VDVGSGEFELGTWAGFSTCTTRSALFRHEI
jgi:hypothetical protein